MGLNRNKCKVPEIYCGKQEVIPNNYSSRGTPLACLRKGFGAGYYSAKTEHLTKHSLLKIKYVKESHIPNFRKHKIYSQISLVSTMKKLSAKEKLDLLRSILKNKNGTVNVNALNYTLLFLDDHNVKNLPQCI